MSCVDHLPVATRIALLVAIVVFAVPGRDGSAQGIDRASGPPWEQVRLPEGLRRIDGADLSLTRAVNIIVRRVAAAQIGALGEGKRLLIERAGLTSGGADRVVSAGRVAARLFDESEKDMTRRLCGSATLDQDALIEVLMNAENDVRVAEQQVFALVAESLVSADFEKLVDFARATALSSVTIQPEIATYVRFNNLDHSTMAERFCPRSSE